MLLIIASKRKELIWGAILEELTETIKLYPILAHEILRTYIGRKNLCRYQKQHDRQDQRNMVTNKLIHKLYRAQKYYFSRNSANNRLKK